MCKGDDGLPDHHPISHLEEYTALQGILAFVFSYNSLATESFLKAQFLSGCLCAWVIKW